VGTLAAPNYRFTATNGQLTVTAAPLTVAANNTNRSYGAPNPAWTCTITGYQNGENATTAGVTGTAAMSTTAAANSPVAGNPYTISCGAGTLTAPNYSFTPANGQLTVTTAPLTVTANNTNRPYGAPNPPFTGAISNLMSWDHVTESFYCAATNTSPVGTNYPIMPVLNDPAGRLTNYLVTTNDGVLTVNPATLLTAPSWLGNGQFQFSFNTTAGQNYTIQYSTDLVHWSSFVELEGDGGILTITDFNASDPHRFYRVASP
jgi:hypothetical protein